MGAFLLGNTNIILGSLYLALTPLVRMMKTTEEIKENKNGLPKDWKWVKLGEACDVIMGQSPPSTSYNTDEIGLPFFQGKAEFTDLYPIVEKWCNGPNKIAEPNDILLSVRAPVGTTNIADQKCCIGRGLAAIRFENYKYAFYFLRSRQHELDSKGTGTTFRAISGETLRATLFPLPPKPAQQAIVAKIEELFSELDKGIEQLKTAQQQLKTYRQSVLKWGFEGKLTEEWRLQGKDQLDSIKLLKKIIHEKEEAAKTTGKKFKPLTAITDEERAQLPALPNKWTWVKLGDNAFVTKLAGFEFTKYVKYKDEGDIPVIRAQNVSKSSFIPRNFLYVDREIMEKLPRSRVYGGEILMVFVGAGLGNVGIVPPNHDFFLGPNVAKIALEKQFDNKYIFHFLSSKLGFASVTGMSKATAQGSISMGNIREVSVPLTSIEEQKVIAQEIESRLSVADKMEESITQSLQQAEALRQSILKKAFEGKLI